MSDIIKAKPTIKHFIIFKNDEDIFKLQFEYNTRNQLIRINEMLLIDDEFVKMGASYTRVNRDMPLEEIKLGLIDMYMKECTIVFIKGDNEKVAKAHNCSKLFSILGHELHLLRIQPLQKLCVSCADGDWKLYRHNIPEDINVFGPALNELLINAVDLGNWSTILRY